MNKARLEWHRKRSAETAEYFRKLNDSKMQEWQNDNAGIDRNDPVVLDARAANVWERALRLIAAGRVLGGERREGALKRARRFVDETHALQRRAAALRAGEKPLDEWARCRCGSAFQPGPRGFTQCYECSSKEWIHGSYSCIFCSRRHSMSYPLCFMCKQERTEDGKARFSEDDARFLRTMVNRRDNYVCQICGVDAMEVGCELQVHRINPELSSDPWNMETLCVSCDALVGKSYDKLDERAYWVLVQAYIDYLWEYLSTEDTARLCVVEPDTEREQIDFGHRVPWPDLGECSEEDGILEVLKLGAVLCR
jgi:hypothetical protein